MVIKRLILCLVVLIISSCSNAKKVIGYDDAVDLFTVGMTFEDVESQFGAPNGILDMGEIVLWDYVPSPPESFVGQEYLGYNIVFRDARTISIQKVVVRVGGN